MALLPSWMADKIHNILESKISTRKFSIFKFSKHRCFKVAKIMWDSMFISAEFHTLQTCNCITKVACCNFTQLSVKWLCNFWYIICCCITTWPSGGGDEGKSRLKDCQCTNLRLSIQHSFSLGKDNLKRYQCLMCLCFIQTCRLL